MVKIIHRNEEKINRRDYLFENRKTDGEIALNLIHQVGRVDAKMSII